MRITPVFRTRLSATAICLAMATAGGCVTQQSADLAPVKQAYNAGDYRDAYLKAHAISDAPLVGTPTRQAAAYYAGLAAYRLSDLDRAQQELEFASRSESKKLSANALATLGLVYTAQGRYDLAADALLAAVPEMSGQDRANAYYYGGIAQQKMGRWPAARTSLSLAISDSRDPAFRALVEDALRVTGFTLQTGAFEVQDHARKAADGLADKVVAMHMGRPRIVPSTDPATNRRLYLVEVGEFSSWPTALAAREELGITNSIVVPLSMR